MSFAKAVDLYEVAEGATASRKTVTYPLAHRFSAEVKKMSRAIEPFEDDDLWGAFIRRCRRLLRDVSVTPLSPSDAVFDLLESARYLESLADQANHSYPDDVVARARLCAAALENCGRDETNPLGAEVMGLLNSRERGISGVVTKTRHLDRVRSWLADTAPEALVLTETDLPDALGFGRLVMVGPSCWFPDHVLSAPRAEKLYFVYYGFYRDREPGTGLFTGSHWSPTPRIESPPLSASLHRDDELDAASLIPTVDWGALQRASGGRNRSSDAETESVPANLFLLADGLSVYLEAADGPMIDVVVDLAPGSYPKLRSERARTVQPGDYIVVRSEGGSGDYIPAIADARLGAARAARLRAAQADWKRALRAKVSEYGFSKVERDLRELGVNSPNLQYRLWKNSLRSRDPNDFRTLMQYIGLGDRAEQIWVAMEELFDAHLGAGQDVRRLLEQAVVASDTERLLQTGRADIRLPDIDAGTLSVLRVEGRAPATVAVDEDELRVLVRVEADLWQG